jgi:hypothetical protein
MVHAQAVNNIPLDNDSAFSRWRRRSPSKRTPAIMWTLAPTLIRKRISLYNSRWLMYPRGEASSSPSILCWTRLYVRSPRSTRSRRNPLSLALLCSWTRQAIRQHSGIKCLLSPTLEPLPRFASPGPLAAGPACAQQSRHAKPAAQNGGRSIYCTYSWPRPSTAEAAIGNGSGANSRRERGSAITNPGDSCVFITGPWPPARFPG